MNEDMLNVMGSFISTELDAFENLHKELEENGKEIERLTAESTEWESKYYDMQDNYHNANEEIERLNNIIDKAKTYCEDVIIEHENGEYDVDTTWLAIKEHKGNIKFVLNILNGDLENYWRGEKE